MKFYLVYKNNGLYDPMLDDSEEYVYVPTGPNELDEESNAQTQEQKDSVDQENGSSKPDKPEKDADNLEDLLKLNLNYKNVFPELNLEELPPQTKYKLPVSKYYDPEGKLVKQQEEYYKYSIIDYENIRLKLDKEKKDTQSAEVFYKKDVYDESMVEKKEVSEDSQSFSILEEEIELRKIKQTALQVIEDNISKAISKTDQLKNKTDISIQNKYQQREENDSLSKILKQTIQTERKLFDESNKEKVKSETKRVSFKDDYEVLETEMLSDDASKRDVRVSDEIKKFEKFDLPMDSKLNVEERKLLTRLDIAESIEAGTVRQRTGIFKTETDKIVTNKTERKVLETAKRDIKTNIELTKQNVYNIGFQVIPRVRNAVQFSQQSNSILKRFLLQMTKVMVTLYRFIPLHKRYNYAKVKEFYEVNKQNREYTQKIDVNNVAFSRETYADGAKEIRKQRLSGAKIAQIEGLKPAELTDRMNIVISEFLRKSGKEDLSEEAEYQQSQTTSSKSSTKDEFMSSSFDKSQTEDEFRKSSFKQNIFDKQQTGEEFVKGSPFRQKAYEKSGEYFDDALGKTAFSNKKMFEETYETQTRSFETREMKEEKRSSESKTSKVHSYDNEFTQQDNVPLTYIAIVEAHVYTNKNAIFEEQKRRMSESMKKSTESDVIYYRCEVSVFYRQFREPSLPPTVVIESIEEIPSEAVFEEEKQEILQTSSTVYEDAAKKLAVQKISEVIEPLLDIKEVKSVTIKQAYPAVERAVKVAIETSEIKEEEKSGFVEIFETDERKSRTFVEPTTKSIAETNEMFIEEESVGMIDVPLPIAQLPQPVKVERQIKTVAETSEVVIDESSVEIVDTSKTTSAIPRYTIADNLHSIAETMIAIIAEPKSESLDEVKITQEKVKIGVDEMRASEVSQVYPQEPVCEELVMSKVQSKEAKVDIYAKVVAEITEVSVSEKEQDSFDVVNITAQEPGPLREESVLYVGETEIVLPFEPSTEPFDLNKVISQQASLEIKESKGIETIITQVEEPKEKSVEALEFKEKHTQPFIEDKFLAAAETLSVLPEEPSEAIKVNENVEQHANIEVVELKTATVTSVTVEEPKQETMKTPDIVDQDPSTAFEASLLTVAENTIITPEGPHHGYLEIPTKETMRPKTLIEGALTVAETIEVGPTSPEGDFNIIEVLNHQARVSILESKSITTTFVEPQEPKEKELVVHQFIENKPHVMLQDSTLTIPTAQEILPCGPKDDDLTISKPIEEKATLDFEEIKPLSISIVTPNEPHEKSLEVLQVQKYVVEEPIFETINLSAANTTMILSEESSTAFDVTEASIQQAKISVVEQKAAEATVMLTLESREKDVIIPEITKKTPQTLLESPLLTAAHIFITVSEEKVDEIERDLSVFSKSISKIAKVTYETCQSLILTAMTVYEDAVSFVGKALFMSNQAKEVTEKSAVTAIANITSVTVTLDEGVAALTVEIKEIDSASSTISSAPSSPFIQEYVFGVAGHEYRVQSPQETSLDIKQSQKGLYGFDSADTSYTLTFEAAYVDEKEVFHMEEFSDNINKFWISDVKTMETLESSDARLHLTNLSVSAISDAQSKVSVQDSAVIVKSRSQSFDTSADFEVSLQSVEELKVLEASDVQTAATINLKSETSFKTAENVESMAKVNIKSKSAKSYSEQSVDVAYGLTIEDEIEVDSQAVELDMQVSDAKIAKSRKRMVKKSSKLTEADIEASYNYEAGMNVESRSISKESYAAAESSVSQSKYLAMQGIHESSTVSEEFSSVESSLQSTRGSESNLAMSEKVMQAKLESSSISQSSAMSIEASNLSTESYATEVGISEVSSKQAKQTMAVEKSLSKTQVGAKIGSQLSLEAGFKTIECIADGVRSPSPEDIPSPQRDEYIFRLLTEEPEETTFIPRDCSFTPESVHEEPIIPVKGMIPHIDTKFVRILYSPPLDTPPASQWKKEPVFTKPGLKGGSETPEFTKEEILEIGRKSALLASAIDKTIRSIEEYKESVGISDKKEKDTKEERNIDEENDLLKSIDSEGEKDEETDHLTKLDVRKKDKGKPLKSILSKFMNREEPIMEGKSIASEILKNVETMVDPAAPVEQQLAQMRAQMAALAELPSLINQKLESVNQQICQISMKESKKTEVIQEKKTEIVDIKEHTEETATRQNSEVVEAKMRTEETAATQNNAVEVKKRTEGRRVPIAASLRRSPQRMRRAQTAYQHFQQQYQPKFKQEERVSQKNSVEITEMGNRDSHGEGIQIRVTKPSLTGEELDVEKREELRRSLEDLRMRKSVSPAKDQFDPANPLQGNLWRPRPAPMKPEPAFGTGDVRPIYLPSKKMKLPDYDEEQITETLVGQAEVIKGKVLGVNFKKFVKPPVSLDHLKHSEVYRLVHNLDDEPKKQIDMMRPVAFAASEIRELEVLVDFSGQGDSQLVEKTLVHLKSQDGVTQAIYKDGAVVVETTLPSSVVLDMVQKTSGKRAVLQGFGESQSAVAMISSQSCCKSKVLGVIRFQQSSAGPLVGDGSVHGLAPGAHGLHVRHTGDLSMGCESIGEHYNPYNAPHGGPNDPADRRHAGDLGNIVADEEGRATFRIVDNILKIHEIVGRSIAVTERADDLGVGSSPASKIDGDSGKAVACGIIARSAGVFQNPKRICACDGVVVWDERDRPLAGKGRTSEGVGRTSESRQCATGCCKI
ncbi:uncharacterized protein LOC112058522 [Bicyclus anynana]|uniref:superoxide dismutase n=1 Tax=Bicyclus anynana TaxID=110368 RepID=A0ABM3M3C9_BICAN|nr:uncharacterized protein LOC112058522 [Bicyclus anynana]